MAPKRSRVSLEAEPAGKGSSKHQRSLQMSEIPVPAFSEAIFSSASVFQRYTQHFHGRDIVFGRRFDLSALSATGLQFEDLLVQSGLRNLAILEDIVFPEWVWQFYCHLDLEKDGVQTCVQGHPVSLTGDLINRLLGIPISGTTMDDLLQRVQPLSLHDRAMTADEWLLHRFSSSNLIGRSGSVDTITSVDLTFISAIYQGLAVDFGSFFINKVRSMRERLRNQSLTTKRPNSLSYGRVICAILTQLQVPSSGLQALTLTDAPMDHVSLLRAHYCRYEGAWVRSGTLSRQQASAASKETMAAARAVTHAAPPSLSAPAASTDEAPPASPEVPDVQEILMTAEAGIDIAMSTDNLFGFMPNIPSPSLPDIQGERPSLTEDVAPGVYLAHTQGEPSEVSTQAASPQVQQSTFMEMLFEESERRPPADSGTAELRRSVDSLEMQVSRIKDNLSDLYNQFISFRCITFEEIASLKHELKALQHHHERQRRRSTFRSRSASRHRERSRRAEPESRQVPDPLLTVHHPPSTTISPPLIVSLPPLPSPLVSSAPILTDSIRVSVSSQIQVLPPVSDTPVIPSVSTSLTVPHHRSQAACTKHILSFIAQEASIALTTVLLRIIFVRQPTSSLLLPPLSPVQHSISPPPKPTSIPPTIPKPCSHVSIPPARDLNWQDPPSNLPYSCRYSQTVGKIPWSIVQSPPGVFNPLPAGPSNPSSIYSLSLLKGRNNLVNLVEAIHRGYELTGLYQECPRMFGDKRTPSFAEYLVKLAVHGNLVAQTFFRSLWLNNCIHPPPTEPPPPAASSEEGEPPPPSPPVQRTSTRGNSLPVSYKGKEPVVHDPLNPRSWTRFGSILKEGVSKPTNRVKLTVRKRRSSKIRQIPSPPSSPHPSPSRTPPHRQVEADRRG